MNTRRTRHSEEITSPKPYADVGRGRFAVNTIAKTSVKGQDDKETEAKQDSTSKKTETITSVLRVKVDLEDDKPMKKGVRSVKKRKVQPDSAAVEQPQRPDDRMKAKDFPPGLATTISCGLFDSKEPQTVANLLQKMLCVQNMVPPLHLVEKLMDLLKYGPKAEGSSVYFKDPLRTELASSYAYALVEASSRLVRKDDSALFGPSSWDDVEVLLSQSIDQTENAMSGRRLAHGLHMAACGAKLLCLMLKTELLKSNLSSSANFSFGTLSMKLMPTVKVLKTKGLRNALKAVVRHATKCLVRHSKWILDHDPNDLSSVERASAECCAAEAKTCFDCLGSVLCYTAWLFCAEEGIEINHPNCAFVIRDAFLSELTRYIEKLPEMSSRKKTTHIKKLKWYFILSFVEEFASSLQDSVGKMIGLEDSLDCFKVETTAMTQTCDDVSDGNLASSCPSQFIRKSNAAVMLNQAKSSRYLTGEKLNPLTSNIIQDDLRQMEAYDEACKAFRIRSFLSCNSESMKAAQSDTDLLSPQTIVATHSVVERPPPISDASDPNPQACASDPVPRPILHPRFNHPGQYGDNDQACPPSNTSFVPMEKSRPSSPTTSYAYVSPPVSVQQQQSTPLAVTVKPKRPLSAFNLFYRYKRSLLSGVGDISNDVVRNIITCPAGLENEKDGLSTQPKFDTNSILTSSADINEKRRSKIRSALDGNILPADTTKRRHRKVANAPSMDFVEMGRMMTDAWKSTDTYGKKVFDELAAEGRDIIYRRVFICSKQHGR